MNIIKRPVLNQSSRLASKPEFFVIHIIAGTLDSAESWFNTSKSQASANYGIGKNGEVREWVHPDKKSWACGNVTNINNPVSLAHPGINPNLVTINIELEGQTGDTVTDQQWESLVELIQYLAPIYNIPLDRKHIIGHYEIDPVTRPFCPGKGVDLDKLVQDTQPKKEVKKVEEWKLQIIKDAFTNGLITDCEEWMRKVEEPAPVWMVLAVANRLMNKIPIR